MATVEPEIRVCRTLEFSPQEKGDDVAHKKNSSIKPRFIEPEGVSMFTGFDVGPAHNTQNNISPNVPRRVSIFSSRQK